MAPNRVAGMLAKGSSRTTLVLRSCDLRAGESTARTPSVSWSCQSLGALEGCAAVVQDSRHDLTVLRSVEAKWRLRKHPCRGRYLKTMEKIGCRAGKVCGHCQESLCRRISALNGSVCPFSDPKMAAVVLLVSLYNPCKMGSNSKKDRPTFQHSDTECPGSCFPSCRKESPTRAS